MLSSEVIGAFALGDGFRPDHVTIVPAGDDFLFELFVSLCLHTLNTLAPNRIDLTLQVAYVPAGNVARHGAPFSTSRRPADNLSIVTFELMLPTLRKFPFSDPAWIFEPKWDGYRSLCLVDDGTARFLSRNQKELTGRFPQLADLAQDVTARTVLLDGEIVALDENDRPCFEALQNRRKCSIAYFAFDCLTLDGVDLRQKPLLERKTRLREIVRSDATALRLTEYVVGEGKQLFAALEELGLEGMVAKRSDSLYLPGRTKLWLKIKTRSGQAEMKKRSETWGR